MFFPRLVNMKLNVSQDLGKLYGMLIICFIEWKIKTKIQGAKKVSVTACHSGKL